MSGMFKGCQQLKELNISNEEQMKEMQTKVAF
jgi:hypothetical protein